MAPPEGTNNYGSIKEYDEEATPLVPSNDASVEDLKSSRKKWGIKGLVGGAVAVIVLSYTLWNGQRGSFRDENDSQNDPPTTHTKTLASPTELGLTSLARSDTASPSKVWGKHIDGPLPTNSWYLNLVSHKAAVQPDDSSNVYTVPYRVDTAAPTDKLSGVRVHWPVLQASDRNVQMVDDFKNMLALGAGHLNSSQYVVSPHHPLSPIGVSLEWTDGDASMETHLVRGMPYVTMKYTNGALPRLYSYNGPASDLEIDGTKGDTLQCGIGEAGNAVTVQKELKFHAFNSDFTWIVFFSQPVQATCQLSSKDIYTRDWQLDVTSIKSANATQPLVVRLALLDQCTTGMSNIKQHCAVKDWSDPQAYEDLLRQHASAVPTSPKIHFAYHAEEKSPNQKNGETMTIDWAVESTDGDDDTELLAFALPHHQVAMGKTTNITNQCINTFHGSTCLVKGNHWTLSEDLGEPMSFTAPRPPEASAIDTLAKALSKDIQYKLSDNMHRGAADTYFSGKLLARLGRVIVIADELRSLAAGAMKYDDVDDDTLQASVKAAKSASLPSDNDMKFAINQLKQGVEVWLTKPEATYLYDKSWGGFINCGCRYTTKDQYGVCNNTFPDCPAVEDVNQDFGNAWYADHHYHYGYHVYAAAVAAKFDPEWGAKYFDQVMMYIRDFANPFHDEYFVQFRQKDWFLGSSWASGIMSAETSPHGRDQESSSEAIAAYEAVTLYGSVMSDIFAKTNDSKLASAETVRKAGQLLAATEIHATNRYWHVWDSPTHNTTYPIAYKEPVVGMMHETMASFETWFSQHPVVSYGIQLMPLTPAAEQRDDPEWASIVYPLYKDGCEEAGDFCVDNGWSILQAGLLATTGDRKEALQQALAVPAKVYDSQGGLGNSLSNLIWYIATRKPYSPHS